MKPIRTPEAQTTALGRVDALASRAEHLTDAQRDELDVLVLLLERYEQESHPLLPPTPLEAIRFRMEQMGYRQKDLAELLGGASRASEVMAGKRGLSPAMMRRLRDAWGIPADSLLGADDLEDPGPDRARASRAPERNPKDFPMKQMYERGYFPDRSGNWRNDRKDAAGMLQAFFHQMGDTLPTPALHRQGGGAHSKINSHALDAWRQRVLIRVVEEGNSSPFDRAALDEGYLHWLAGLSCLAEGPRLACEALGEKGIAVVIEPRLDETHLDGAALLGPGGCPVIGLTLRHDRLDNFWFTLFHEIGHVLLHLTPDQPVIFDSEIDRKRTGTMETEADQFGMDRLIPPAVWEDLKHLQTGAEIRTAAAKLRLHPAVIAGRLRRAANDYRKHPSLIGSGRVREVFGYTVESWPK